MEFTKEQIEMYEKMAKSMNCGGCGLTTTVLVEYTCEQCGRMLCENCGNRWGVCKDHRPLCYHPEIVPTQWNQKKPKPAIVVGMCKHTYSCPICGYGQGQFPCPCNRPLHYERLEGERATA